MREDKLQVHSGSKEAASGKFWIHLTDPDFITLKTPNHITFFLFLS